MRTLLFSLFLLATAAISASPYYVFSIKGEIFQGDEPLAPRDQLEETTELRFIGQDAQAYVMSPLQGYLVLGPGQQSTGNGSEFLLAVKQALLPASEWKMTGMRGGQEDKPGIELQDTYDMLDFFRGRIAIVDNLEVFFSADYFSNPAGQLELQVFNPADKTAEVYHATADSLEMAFLLEKSIDFNGSFMVRYLPDYEEDELLEAEHFELVQVDPEQLKEELRYLYELTPEEDRQFFSSQTAVNFVTSRYGKMHPPTLNRLLNEVLTVAVD